MKRKSKDTFAETMLALLNDYTVDDITVNMIVDNSQLSHATFYRNFKNKYDVLTYIFHNKISNFYFAQAQDNSYFNSAKITLQYAYDHVNFFKNILTDKRNVFTKLTIHKYSQIMSKKLPKLTYTQNNILMLYISGNLYTSVQWFLEDKHYPIDYLIHLYKLAMPEVLKEIFNEQI